MPILTKCVRWSLVCVTLSQSACGGGSSVESAPPAPAPTTLSISAATLALAARNDAALPAAIPGTPRMVTVTNVGTAEAQDVALSPPVGMPAGTHVISNCGGTLAPLASCTFTITPGKVATTAPVALSIQGRNTNTVSSTVQVLAYSSVYQGGYVFAIDDTTPNTHSVGGKVAAMVDTARLPWSPNNDVLAGIDERSVAPPCEGAVDGACNTDVIVAHYTGLADPATYAAGVCATSTAEGFMDWYLPAICEAGYDGTGSGTGCGTRSAPTLQNMYMNVRDGAGLAGHFWTSTTVSTFAGSTAFWMQDSLSGAPEISHHIEVSRLGTGGVARCVRALTP